jgi:hypothetical protein
MLLYHGSNTTVNTPQLIEQTRGLDFGSGFYLTTNEKQAAIITLKVSKLTDQICLKTGKALSLLKFIKTYETSGRNTNG